MITIGSIFVVSAAFFQTGVATRLGRGIVRLAGESELRLIAALMIGAALLSGVMNNVAVTAVLMPAVIGISEESLRLGDAFLVQGPWHKIRLLRDQPGLLVISE